MAYNKDMTWDDVVGSLGFYSNKTKSALLDGLEAYNEWQSFRAGRTNAEIATSLSVDETWIAEADAAYAALFEIYQSAANFAVSQSDRFYSLRKFT